ncbi:MAG: VOC family protein [Rhodocyclaceae bacterium]|nr:VOC family protein [Rhodocyclaceae bacterium]
MKRFHVHLKVADLDASIAFYSRLLGAEPTRIEGDYAKWMLDEPRINFAISCRGGTPGVDHLGFQVDSEPELAAIKEAARAAGTVGLDEGETTCCYARSEKHWVVDPDGLAWEHFHTLADIPVFSSGTSASDNACCAATAPTEAASAKSACRAPAPAVAAGSCRPSGNSSCC